MKNCVGIAQTDYGKRRGRRMSVSPMVHYPDYCPHYAGDSVGDCIARCANVPLVDRPCFIEAARRQDCEAADVATDVCIDTRAVLYELKTEYGREWSLTTLGSDDEHTAKGKLLAIVEVMRRLNIDEGGA